jgi:hypothetical protein
LLVLCLFEGSFEITRKGKALQKAKAEATYLMQAQYFLRQVLLNQYKHLKNSKRTRTPVKDTKSVDYINILKLQYILEENMKSSRFQGFNNNLPREEPKPRDKNQQTLQIEVLGKLLRGN